LDCFYDFVPRIRRTDVRPIRNRRAISDLLTPARCSFRISAVCRAAVAGRAQPLAVLPGVGQTCPNAELWSAAIAVARRDGINQTAAALRLDGGKLKRLMLAAKASPRKTMPSATFVELMNPHIGGLPECTIELEGQNRKLRIHWKGATAADVSGLSRVLWDVAS
jgi:hypothetical protein